MDVLFVISHKPDNRYKKRLELIKNTFETGIVYWNKEDEPKNFSIEGVNSLELHIKANRTNPLKRIPQTLKFISKAIKEVEKQRPKLLYVGNLDMLMVAARYKYKHKEAKIVYEIADLHRLIIDRQKTFIKRLLSQILKITEKILTRSIDILVLTSMKFYDVYYSDFIDKKKVIFLPNMPEEDSFAGFKKLNHDKFTIGFIGWIRYKNQLRMLIEASQKANIDVVFAGEDGESDEFKKYCERFSNVTYIGPFVYEKEIKSMYGKVDCVYAVYDADMANVRVALPNKLYEAMLCEMPIIVAQNTYLSELVLDMGIGVAVNHKDVNDLTMKLKRLSSDSGYYEAICDNCRKCKETVKLSIYNRELLERIKEVLS